MKNPLLHSHLDVRYFLGLLAARALWTLAVALSVVNPVLSIQRWSVIGTALAWAPYLVGGIWLYSFHRDLQLIWPDYPVGPWYAIGLRYIPGYNIWGTWALWKRFSERLRWGEADRLMWLVGAQYVIWGLIFLRQVSGRAFIQTLSGLQAYVVATALLVVADCIIHFVLVLYAQRSLNKAALSLAGTPASTT